MARRHRRCRDILCDFRREVWPTQDDAATGPAGALHDSGWQKEAVNLDALADDDGHGPNVWSEVVI